MNFALPDIGRTLMFGGAAGVGSALGAQLWNDDNLRRYTIMVVVFLILVWFILLNK